MAMDGTTLRGIQEDIEEFLVAKILIRMFVIRIYSFMQ